MLVVDRVGAIVVDDEADGDGDPEADDVIVAEHDEDEVIVAEADGDDVDEGDAVRVRVDEDDKLPTFTVGVAVEVPDVVPTTVGARTCWGPNAIARHTPSEGPIVSD